MTQKDTGNAVAGSEPAATVDTGADIEEISTGAGEDTKGLGAGDELPPVPDAVSAALLGREVAVLTGPGGGPLSAAPPDGTPVVPLFTSPVFPHSAGRLAFELDARVLSEAVSPVRGTDV